MTIKTITGGAKKDPYRTKELAKIHTLKKQLGLDDDTYRAMLVNQTSVNSSANMNRGQRLTVIKHLQTQLGKQTHDGRPHNTDSNPQLKKIEALLLTQNRPWNYAHAIGKRMFNKDRLTFCSSWELRAVITALIKMGEKK